MRQKVKTFFHVFTRSLIPNAQYYKKIAKTPFNFSFRYFFIFLLLLNLIFTYQLFQKYNLKKTRIFIDRLINELEKYPNNLIISIKNGYLKTNLNQPYFFWGGYENKRLWLVIDESDNKEEIIRFYNSYFLLNKKSLVFKPNFLNPYYKSFSFNSSKVIEINKNKVILLANFLRKINANLLLLYLLIIPLLFVFIMLSSLFISFFYILIITFISFYFFKLFFHRRIHFKKSFQLGLHAATFPLIVDYFVVIYDINQSLRPGLFFIKNLNSSFLSKLIIPFPLVFVFILTIFIFGAIYETYQNNHLGHNSKP